MVMKLTKIILTMPATNAISERSFSALRCMKTWLSSTMNQTRLNWCSVLHIHNDDTDKLNIVDVANGFVSRNSMINKKSYFWKICVKFLLSFTVSTCLKMHFRHPKISNFSGGACPSYARCCAPSRAAFGSQISTPKANILSTAPKGITWNGYRKCPNQTWEGLNSCVLRAFELLQGWSCYKDESHRRG